MKTLLWLCDGPDMASGFGNELRQFVSYLTEYKHIVIDPYQAKFLLENAKYTSFSFGRLRSEEYNALKDYDVDAILTLGGLWMKGDVERIKQLHKRAKWIALYRVDGLPLNMLDHQILKADVDKTVVPSKWLENELKRYMLGCKRISEGISLDLFKRLSNERRKELKIPFEGKLVYGCTNRNIYPRKFYDILLTSFAKFSKNKDDVCLFLHCDCYDKEGLPLLYLTRLLDLEKKVVLSTSKWDVGVQLPNLVDVYNQIDIWTSTSGGEAFGRGYIEALACGCNVIAPKHTTFDELIKGHGLGVNTVASIFPPRLGYFFKIPSVEHTVEQMERYYKDETLRDEHKSIAQDFVKNYDIKKIMNEWREFLGQVVT